MTVRTGIGKTSKELQRVDKGGGGGRGERRGGIITLLHAKPYPDVVKGRLAGDVVEQEQRCKQETDDLLSARGSRFFT